MKDFVIVSFYTKGTGYAKLAPNLRASLERFKMPYEIEAIDNRGSWLKNTQYKTIYCRQKIKQIDAKGLVWIDIDAVLKRKPELFYYLWQLADVGFHFHRWGSSKWLELLSGTMYFKKSKPVIDFLDTVIEMHIKRPGVRQQRAIQKLLAGPWGQKLEVFNLPPEYTKIYDLMREVKNPVIEHYQASRKLKNKVSLNGTSKKNIMAQG